MTAVPIREIEVTQQQIADYNFRLGQQSGTGTVTDERTRKLLSGRENKKGRGQGGQ
jgi:hypothetical protein